MPSLGCGMWTQLQHVESSSLTRDRTQAPCIGSTESCPLDHQGSPSQYFLKSGPRWGLGLPQVTWTFNHWALGSSGPSDHLVKLRSVASRQKISNRDSLTATTLCAFPVLGFSSSHVRMWELDQKEGWAPKNWCFWILVLKKTWKFLGPQGEISPKGNQPWILIGKTDESPILWPPDVKSWLMRKTLMLGKTKGKMSRGWEKMRWLE